VIVLGGCGLKICANKNDAATNRIEREILLLRCALQKKYGFVKIFFENLSAVFITHLGYDETFG